MTWLESAICLAQCNAIGALEVLGNIATNAFARVNPSSDLCTSSSARFNPSALNGRVCVVTGGNAGIGLETSKLLAACGAHVIVACRSAAKGMATVEMLKGVMPLPECRKLEAAYIPLDLANNASVLQFVEQFKAYDKPLDLLICNAGIMAPPKRCVAPNKLELQFQVNHLGHWLLTHELLRVQIERHLKGIARSCSPRIIFLTSLTHWGGRKSFADPHASSSYDPLLTYGDSKLANLLTVKELQRRFDRNPVTSHNNFTAVAVHPGLLYTELACTWMENNFSGFMRPAAIFLLREWGLHKWWTLPAICGADTVFRAATAPAKQVAGRYIASGKLGWQAPKGNDEKSAQYLWDLSCALTATDTPMSLA